MGLKKIHCIRYLSRIKAQSSKLLNNLTFLERNMVTCIYGCEQALCVFDQKKIPFGLNFFWKICFLLHLAFWFTSVPFFSVWKKEINPLVVWITLKGLSYWCSTFAWIALKKKRQTLNSYLGGLINLADFVYFVALSAPKVNLIWEKEWTICLGSEVMFYCSGGGGLNDSLL